MVTVGHGKSKGSKGKDGTKRQPVERALTLAWDGKLPAPVLEAETATYPGVRPGVDLVVESRRSGFEQHFMINSAAAVSADGDLSWSFTVKTKGLTGRVGADGSVSFTDPDGVVVSTIPPALAWDAAVDERTGDPASTSPVALALATKGNKTTITVTPDAAWLADPARVFPITVDPTYAAASVGPSFDAFVQSDTTADRSTSTELKVGTFDGGATKARSFLSFPLSGLRGKQVMSASLSLQETYSYSCTPATVEAWHTGGGVSASTRWTSQPTWNTKYGSLSAAKGYSSSCPQGRIAIPVTGLAQKFADSTATSGTVGLRATSETAWACQSVCVSA